MTHDSSNHDKPSTPSTRGQGWVIAQLGLFAAIALAPRDLGGLPAWPEPLARAGLIGGAISAALGGGIASLGLLHLGANLTIFPRPKDDGELIRNGVYKLTRHPIYTGVILLALGWSLLRASTPSLLLSFALALFFDRKAAYEERWLAQKFPEYGEYRRRVRKLIPWVY
jgi:protein-S-isoprenylcysteine O-methyltransferase Ste14